MNLCMLKPVPLNVLKENKMQENLKDTYETQKMLNDIYRKKDYSSLEGRSLAELQKIQTDFKEQFKDFVPEPVNVICIKWGNAYSAEDVNKLFHSVVRYTFFHQVNFYCFTDDSKGLDKEIIVKPLPVLNVAPEDNKYAYKKEAGLCDDHLGGLTGKRVFFFDLDSLIVGALDSFFAYPQGDKFYTINDWKHRRGKKANKVGQASCYSWVVGTLGYVKKYFEEHPKEMVARYYTASQEYLSAKVIEKEGKLNFWPDNWFKSYRFHCMPNPLLRWFVTPRLPKVKGLKMVAFHGLPGIADAIKGIWTTDKSCPKRPKGYKHLYKHVKPADWIKEYWQ